MSSSKSQESVQCALEEAPAATWCFESRGLVRERSWVHQLTKPFRPLFERKVLKGTLEISTEVEREAR